MMPAARVAFVTEAGPEVGWGHLARCLALARAGAAIGARAFFVVEAGADALARLRAAGADAVGAPWRRTPARALETIRARGADVAVVDSYGAGAEVLAAIRSAAGRLVVVDDTADRPLTADVVVNGGLGAESLPYPRAAGTRLLLGPRYALLGPDFAASPDRPPRDRVVRVLVTLGGGTPGDAVLAAVEAVDRTLEDCAVDVAVGARGEPGRLERLARAARNAVTVHAVRPGLRDLMLAADLAVTGGGVTLLELAACATPAVVVRMADNQRPNVEAGVRGGVALPAGAAGDPDLGPRIEAALRRLVPDAGRRRAMGARARALVDGRGASRVVEALAEAAVAR